MVSIHLVCIFFETDEHSSIQKFTEKHLKIFLGSIIFIFNSLRSHAFDMSLLLKINKNVIKKKNYYLLYIEHHTITYHNNRIPNE